MLRAKSISTSVILAFVGSALGLTSCGLELNDTEPRTSRENTPCRGFQNNFPASKEWSSELLTTLLSCSSNSSTIAGDTLQTTAKWLNESFDTKHRLALVNFLESVPRELGPMLLTFSASTNPSSQKHWPEWIRWTQLVISDEVNIRPAMLAEQLYILSQVPPSSIDALVGVLEKLRISDAETRTRILERLAKVYQDFSRDPTLKNFLIKGIIPLECLKLEADRQDTSLISSGWSLLVNAKDDPIMFGRTFAQSYGLLQNFCQDSEIPTNLETHAALDYFVRNHSEVFAPILKITDNTTRALIPLLRLWSSSELSFTDHEFIALVDTLSKVSEAAHTSSPLAFASYIQVLSQWSRGQSASEITRNMTLFKQVDWKNFVVPQVVVDEWSSGAQKHRISFLETLGQYITQDSHKKMAELLRSIKIRNLTSVQKPMESPVTAPKVNSISQRLFAFVDAPTTGALPAQAKFLECLKSMSLMGLWSCLQAQKEQIPYSKVLMQLEAHDPLFFDLRDSEQPGRWLGQGFFSAGALTRWTKGMESLRGLNLPIGHFVMTFPFAELVDDQKISETYNWLRAAPQTQPEGLHLRNELGIPLRLKPDDFSNVVWRKWFADPAMWTRVQFVLSDPRQGPTIIKGLKKLTKQKIRVRLFRSDDPGLTLTSAAEIGMLSALDILLWEAPYDWNREWIIAEILAAKTPADLADVLRNSRDKLQTAYRVLDSNPISRNGKLWKKSKNALTILDATIALRIENELFAWSGVMKALAAGLGHDEAKEFLVSLQKTGIISSISHLLNDRNPNSTRFANTLIEVFHLIRNSKANDFAWNSAILENQKSHGLFVYQILALCHDALKSPAQHYHLKQMTSLVRTGSYWIEKEKRLLPFKTAFDTISGPESVFNPWIWVFLREIQDNRSKSHKPWKRVLTSLETSAARDDIRAWLKTGIPENIGAWMDAFILTPSTRF